MKLLFESITILSQSFYYYIYRDSSQTTAGIGRAFVSNNKEIGLILNINSSIFTAELSAILNAVQLLENRTFRKFAILKDSKSSLQAIKICMIITLL